MLIRLQVVPALLQPSSIDERNYRCLIRDVSRERRFSLRRRRVTQNWREGQWQRRRPWRRDFSLREREMFSSTSTSLRVARFFQGGPKGGVSGSPLRKRLILD